MKDEGFHRNLRLGLVGFSAEEALEITALVRAAWTPAAPWVVSQDAPMDGVLLARGTRVTDPEHSAVLRVNVDPGRRLRADLEKRLDPIMLRKPVRAVPLKVALEAACARLRRYQR